ncbi:peptidoglycan/xylan/chitin deacetylase (PgdA/CDA1 family) [Natronobacillus azotifigens]|uniref:Polysaccharide deacetylase family protein n=1 Tax=Natronobacillus azotifigens TaxID=472978 RepID=A0A9J6R8Q9_9BACI|nr:polysaccharide deacetylase family protein [Natronobacillus azotifigens]MCZ0701628.1 polysaccharide deacetylase family protein [Natronobacillus azotifigens]
MTKNTCKWILFGFIFLFLGPFLGITPSSATPQREDFPNPEGGSELTERVRYPVSNYILQERYPEIMVLSGDRTKNQIALTFDDGPDPRFTPDVLDVLKEYDVQATFFVTGARAEEYPDLLQRINEEGHIIGNHTYGHPNLVEKADLDVLESEVKRTEDIIAGFVGYRTKLFRAPYGFLYNELVETLGELNYSVVGWTVDSLDWQESEPEVISYNVLSNVHPGAIILMHDGAEWEGDRTNTIKSLHRIIPTLKDQGLEFVTVPELVDIAYQQ